MTEIEKHCAKLVKGAGAEFVSIFQGNVVFRDPKSGATMTVYANACSVENVALALKNHREDLADPWTPTE